MAGLVVASAVLKGVLSNLSSPVLNEFWLLSSVGEDKDKLQSNLETINAVLQDAERRQVNEMAVKDWLRKIKAAAHDAEDVLDEFRIEALRRKVENQAAGMQKKVGNLFYPPVFRFKMAHKMQKLRKNFEHIAKERSLFHFTVGVVDNQPRISSARETCSKIASEVYGRDTEKADLIDLLIKSESENEEDLAVIPIVGMGGLGKTTLAQLVYNDEQVVNHFKELRMWVYVSENFDVGKLLKEILESAIKGQTEQLSMELLQTRLQKELSGKRYLLVLDDVWNDKANEWYRLKALLTCGANGSKLLVTTRHDAVAKIMHAVPRPRLEILSNEDSWNLFRKLANPPPMCVAIGQEMVEKCRGLPLAIRTLGGLMSSKETVSEWESVIDSSNLWKQQDSDGEILPILQLSYDHLTPSLKQCFAFCAVIPKGHSFVKHKLINQWIALGFIHSDEENELLEEEAEGYFNEILQRSLFQESNDRSLEEGEYYTMHDLIHDLVRFVGEKECFIVKASMDTVPKETRHLTVQDHTWARGPENLEALKKCKKLHSILFTAYFLTDINAWLSLTCLRVLDLGNTDISYLPNSIEKLKHLRYLDISYTFITELPETICNLHSLQTLIITGSDIWKLPKNMKRMISLRDIKLNKYLYHSLLQEGIGEFTCLRTLPTFDVGEVSGSGIEELKGLNQLRGDVLIGGLNHVRNGKCAREANLKTKKHLHFLGLSWSSVDGTAALSWSSDDGTAADTEGNSEEVIENLEPHSRLKQLAIAYYMGMNFPNWMKMLTNLTDIQLRNCNRCEHLPPLWRLPFLESLGLHGMSAVKYIVEFDGSDNSKDIFPCLKHLELYKMFGLEGLSSQQEDGDGDGDEQGRERDEQVILQSLNTLSIVRCPKLTRIPWLRHVSSLTGLQISRVGWDMTEMDGDGDERGRERDEQVILQGLRTLSIKCCPKLTRIPWLRHVSSLTSLEISEVGWDMIEIPASQSLTVLSLSNMPNLERWSVQEADDDDDDGQMIFSFLRKLQIFACPKLICLPQLLLPALEILSMSMVSCDKIEFSTSHSLGSVSLFNMPNLEILSLKASNDNEHVVFYDYPFIEFLVYGCPRMTRLLHLLPSFISLSISESNEMLLEWVAANYTSLSKLSIKGLPEVKHLPEELGPNHTGVFTLKIVNCPKLTSLSNQLENLLALEKLSIKDCTDLVLSLPADGLQQQQQQRSPPPLDSLQVLKIKNSCENQISLPGDGIVLTSLRSLTIVSCRNLESISADMLQNLTSLRIEGCPKLWSSRVSLENLKSIERLNISGCTDMTRLLGSMENFTLLTWLCIDGCPGMWSLPESMKNVKSLKSLLIIKCPGISSLPESMGDLTLLERLWIRECPGITTLPNGLKRLGILYDLVIDGCPGLRRKLRFPKGQDWHKVAHVRQIRIDRVDPRREERRR